MSSSDVLSVSCRKNVVNLRLHEGILSRQSGMSRLVFIAASKGKNVEFYARRPFSYLWQTFFWWVVCGHDWKQWRQKFHFQNAEVLIPLTLLNCDRHLWCCICPLGAVRMLKPRYIAVFWDCLLLLVTMTPEFIVHEDAIIGSVRRSERLPGPVTFALKILWMSTTWKPNGVL